MYRDVFQFIEDVVLIRVSYSLATGHKKMTNQLMHVRILCILLVYVEAICTYMTYMYHSFLFDMLRLVLLVPS